VHEDSELMIVIQNGKIDPLESVTIRQKGRPIQRVRAVNLMRATGRRRECASRRLDCRAMTRGAPQFSNSYPGYPGRRDNSGAASKEGAQTSSPVDLPRWIAC